MWLEICPPFKGVNAAGDFFLQHLCKLVIDPVSDFIKVYFYPHDDHKLEFAKLVHTGVGDYKIDRITIWFSKALLSYLGNFNFKDSHFDQITSGLIFYGQTLDKVVWQYPYLEFISTSQSYIPILATVFVKSSLVDGGELAACPVPTNGESINLDTSIIQWKELKGQETLNIVRFRIMNSSGELVGYQSGNISFVIAIRPLKDGNE